MEQERLKQFAEEELMELEEVDAMLHQEEARDMTEEEADRLIRIYKAVLADYERFQSLAKRQKEEIDRRLRLKAEKYDAELVNIALTLQSFAEKHKMKETKTQKKYQLLSGDIIIKKEVPQLIADKDTLLQAITGTEYSGYVRTKQEVAWSDLKKRLDFTDDGMILDKETGEIVELEGLSVEVKSAEIIIK